VEVLLSPFDDDARIGLFASQTVSQVCVRLHYAHAIPAKRFQIEALSRQGHRSLRAPFAVRPSSSASLPSLGRPMKDHAREQKGEEGGSVTAP
jgi:hypothetical protein